MSQPPKDTISRYISQTFYSDPGSYKALFDGVPTDPKDLGPIACNVIVHYRAYAKKVDPAHGEDVNLRWIGAILQTDAKRHQHKPLAESRELAQRIQGCCRDHSLFCVSVLRHHGIPARMRIGWAGYLSKGFNHDHVTVEFYSQEQGRWVRFDPEMDKPRDRLPNPNDIATGSYEAPFATAAEVWRAYRAGKIDPDIYGVAPGVPVGGPWMMQAYVLEELAHLQGDELLLWDQWGAMASPEGPTPDQIALADEIAALLVRADAGDADAQVELDRRYASDDKLRPGETVMRLPPSGGEPTSDRVGKKEF